MMAPARDALRQRALHFATTPLQALFAREPRRAEQLRFQLDGLTLDLSKQRLDVGVLTELVALAGERELTRWVEKLFAGDPVNVSEGRAAKHWQLRDLAARAPDVAEQLQRMETIVEQFFQRQWCGVRGDAVEHVINLGVGGSDLGPVMAHHALRDLPGVRSGGVSVHFVSSMDGSQLAPLLAQLDPARTVFVISSKSFITVDTLSNARTALAWLQQGLPGWSEGEIKQRHVFGVSAAPERMDAWGIPAANQLLFWDWVGGRYSVWSTIGLPIALSVGMQAFRDFLAGGHAMDQHFRGTPLMANLPVLLALTSIWNINYLDIHTRAILPYEGRLKFWPSYLEQLEMESNGKSVTRDGQGVADHTCPIIWGEVGPNAQHAFYQLLHQGTHTVACEYLLCATPSGASPELQAQHDLTLANALAQMQLMAFGDGILDDADQLPPHSRYRGGQPCTTLLLDALTPYSLGLLVALYEHKVFVEAVMWGINPFDQWGVEMGKQLATRLLPAVQGAAMPADLDGSTRALLEQIRSLREVSAAADLDKGRCRRASGPR
ncbi:glucose-6-phosphate isomerase [Isoalcanivorax beigongshangi]|uniref:Glucose-6-phosphate isomerase n=1 Tax=Isoalcanivorax beigongshangi TaxID=3238810 RepID=A0ABV4AFP8_9GAMM